MQQLNANTRKSLAKQMLGTFHQKEACGIAVLKRSFDLKFVS